MFMTIGQTNFSEMEHYNFIWSYIFISIFYLCVIYVLISAFMTIYVDSFRRVNILEGPPEEEKGDTDENKWHTFLKWFLEWLPSDHIRRLGKKPVDEDEDEDED